MIKKSDQILLKIDILKNYLCQNNFIKTTSTYKNLLGEFSKNTLGEIKKKSSNKFHRKTGKSYKNF